MSRVKVELFPKPKVFKGHISWHVLSIYVVTIWSYQSTYQTALSNLYYSHFVLSARGGCETGTQQQKHSVSSVKLPFKVCLFHNLEDIPHTRSLMLYNSWNGSVTSVNCALPQALLFSPQSLPFLLQSECHYRLSSKSQTAHLVLHQNDYNMGVQVYLTN